MRGAAGGEVLSAVQAASLDVAALAARADEVLGQELYWFPVRHHSPAIARHVGEAIRQRKPRVVFVEGPSEAGELLEFLVDARTRPPVAIYSCFRDAGAAEPGEPGEPARRAAWYPLVSYSPEYVALTVAREIGARPVFMDLPHYALPPAPSARRPSLDELGPRSGFYRLLAQAAGYRSWSETWDCLFERPRAAASGEALRRDVALFCAAVRATTPPEALAADGTLARERFMWQTIRKTLQSLGLRARDAVVVCGGFHVFLDQNDPEPPPPVPLGTLNVTLTPYSYFRISELSGYGAGNRAPRFYERCYEHHAAGRGQEQVVIDHVVDVVAECRRRGHLLSSADSLAAVQHAILLARLRGRNDPVLDDVHDALVTCCCKGNPATEAGRLLEAIDEVDIGTCLGRVTERVGRLPIVADLYEQLARHGLEEIAAREKVVVRVLDKREPADAARSAFLHRLVFLDVNVGAVEREAAPFGQSVFKERWRLKWSPGIESALIERNLHGDTIEAAATTVLRESLGARTVEAGPACRRLVQAVDMDLPQLVLQADEATGHAIDHDDRFCSLADALTSLLLLERYATYRGLAGERLPGLLSRCFDRACFAVPEVASVAPEQWDDVIAGLLALAEPLLQRQDLDAELFATHVRHAASISTMPFLRGAFLGVLTELRRMRPDDLAAELLAYARGGVDRQVVAGDFLHGVLRVSRTAIMLGARSLVAAVDELLRAATDETFLGMVPRLRAAFESLHERQRDALAAHVAELYGLEEGHSLRTLATSVEAARVMAELDGEVAAIMRGWLKGKR